MALLLDDLLVKLDDFSNFRDVSKNTDADRINGYIREAQLREIRSFLGDGLYFALLNDYTPDVDEGTFSEARFTQLWFGVDYSIDGQEVRFNGLKPALVYYAYERFVYNQRLNITRYGSRVLEDGDLSENMPITRKYEVSADSMGLLYQNDTERYINNALSTYPEYERPAFERDTEKIGWKQFKVGHLRGR